MLLEDEFQLMVSVLSNYIIQVGMFICCDQHFLRTVKSLIFGDSQ